MRDEINLGDRVVCTGWKWLNEMDRHGEVVECYRGVASHDNPGIEMLAIKWDDTGLVERGYLRYGGRLTKEVLS